jgi:hypothetical protein
MAESKHSLHAHERPAPDVAEISHDGLPPYWKRAHRDWRFWVGLILMLVAITIYILSEDLAFLPHA